MCNNPFVILFSVIGLFTFVLIMVSLWKWLFARIEDFPDRSRKIDKAVGLKMKG